MRYPAILGRFSLWKWLLVFVGLLTVSYFSLVGVRSVIAYRDVIEAKDLLISAEGTLDEAGLDVTSDELDEVEARLERARGKVTAASGFLSNDPALWVARRLPLIGGQINAARDLAQIGLGGADTGMDAVQTLRKLLAVKDEGPGPLGEKAIRFLNNVEPEVERIEERLGEMRAMQEELQSRTLIPPLSAAVDELDDRIARIEDLAQTYRRAQVLAPGLLGHERPMRYLVLGQDNTEIAATGGLILSYGVVTVDNGRVTDMLFEGTEEQIARWQEQSNGEYIEPPGPLKHLLRKYTWNLGTANWSPDFPAAAQQAEFFYLKGGGEPVDGVIAIDFVAMERLLEVLGPIELGEYQAVIDSENVTGLVLAKTRQAQSPGEPRKAFAAAAAEAILLQTLDLDSDSWGSLLEAIDDLARARHFLVFAQEEELQGVVEDMGWGGEVSSVAGDYLMLVDSSVHGTKGNLILEQEIILEIDLATDGSAAHRVTIHDELPVMEWERRDPSLASAIVLRRRYGSFFRLLVPQNSVLGSVTVNGLAEEGEVEEIAGKKSLGTHFHVLPDESATVTFEYSTPKAVTLGAAKYEYRLLIQKQAGVREIPIELDVRMPYGSQVQGATMNGQLLLDGLTDIRVSLIEDIELVVTFTSPQPR